MNGEARILPDEAITPATTEAPAAINWRALADARLARLVELEHDCSVLRDRMSVLQIEYRELLAASDSQLQRIWELDRERMKLHRRLDGLAIEHAQMQDSFLNSRSWRLTRPLRGLSRAATAGNRGVASLVRAMLRVPIVRRVAGVVARMVPGLHRRLRSRLYPHG